MLVVSATLPLCNPVEGGTEVSGLLELQQVSLGVVARSEVSGLRLTGISRWDTCTGEEGRLCGAAGTGETWFSAGVLRVGI